MKKKPTMKTLTAIIAAALLTLGCRRPIAPIIRGKIVDVQRISYNVKGEVHEFQRVEIMSGDKIHIAVTKGEQVYKIGDDITSIYVAVPKEIVEHKIFHYNAEEGHIKADMILPPELLYP